MLPEDCLNHPWVVDNRAKVANDLILNQPNSGTPLSKEGLKSYLRNKRFRVSNYYFRLMFYCSKKDWYGIFVTELCRNLILRDNNEGTVIWKHCILTQDKILLSWGRKSYPSTFRYPRNYLNWTYNHSSFRFPIKHLHL